MTKESFINNIKKIAMADNYLSVAAKYTLNNLHLVSKLTAAEFITNLCISLPILTTFLSSLSMASYEDLCQEIEIYCAKNIEKFSNVNNLDQKLIKMFDNQLLDSLKLNYLTLYRQENILTNIIEKFKIAKRIYVFTNKNSLKIVEDFAENLISAGFKINVVANYVVINELITTIMPKDLIFFIFDDFKNKPLVNVAEQLKNSNQSIIISKENFHELNNLQGLKYFINYTSLRNSTFDTRKFSLMSALTLIYQKIVTTINVNFAQIHHQARTKEDENDK